MQEVSAVAREDLDQRKIFSDAAFGNLKKKESTKKVIK